MRAYLPRRFALLALPLSLVAASLESQSPDRTGNPFRDRDALEKYIHELTNIVETLVEEIAPRLSREDAGRLRAERYRWKVGRDRPCAPAEKREADPLHELECISERVEARYLELDLLREGLSPDGEPSGQAE